MKKLALAVALLAPPSISSLAYADETVEVEDGPDGEHGEHHEHEAHDPSKTFNWTSNPMPFGSSSYNNVDEHGGTLEPGEEHMSVPFVLVLINFGIILVILGWKVAPMARQMAEKRSDDIKGALDEAAKLRDQAKAKLEEYSSKLRQAETEIDTMIRTMREDAESERLRIIAAAEAQAVALKKDADERIGREIERARVALQREVVLAATAVAEQLLREKSTPADQAKLVDAFLGNVSAAAKDAQGEDLMVTGSLARRYSKAIMDLGAIQGNTDKLGADLRNFAEAMKVSPQLVATVTNPAFPRADRKKIIDALATRFAVQPTARTFLYLLLDKERLSSLPAISREVDAAIEAKAGRVQAEVVSATPLTPAQVGQVTATLEQLSGKKIQLTRREDPALIGGIVAKVGDVIYDGSVRTQLRALRDQMQK